MVTEQIDSHTIIDIHYLVHSIYINYVKYFQSNHWVVEIIVT